MVTCHSNTLLSSTSPAENPSTGFFARSAAIAGRLVPDRYESVAKSREEHRAARIRTFELLLEQEARLG
jgi:hypothetical protein